MAKPAKFNAIIASAEMLRGRQIQDRQSTTAAGTRNEEAWKFYDTLGELSFGVTWFANTLSRIRLTAARKTPGGEEPAIVRDGLANDLVGEIADGIGGQSRLLWGFGNFLPMTGEGYLVGETDESATSWRVYPPEAIRIRGRKGQTRTEIQVDESAWRSLPNESIVTRVWREHPRKWWRAQSPAQVALPIMKELELINRHIVSVLQSRLAGAGILVVPTEITFAPSPEHADAPDPFVAELVDTMITPIGDPGSASAVVPLVVRMPAQYAEALRHITFGTELDRRILNLRDSAIRRLATTLDLPAEVLLGLGEVNHWTGWQITEEAFKTHVAPAVELVCDALTIGYLRPAIDASMSGEDSGEWVVWYDNSELTVRPDHSENVVSAYDRYEVSGQALRRELGLDESDVPTGEELRVQALKKMLNHPVAAELAARELGVISDETAAVRALDAQLEEKADLAPTNGNGAMPDAGGRRPSAEAPGPTVPGLPTTPPRRNP